MFLLLLLILIIIIIVVAVVVPKKGSEEALNILNKNEPFKSVEEFEKVYRYLFMFIKNNMTNPDKLIEFSLTTFPKYFAKVKMTPDSILDNNIEEVVFKEFITCNNKDLIYLKFKENGCDKTKLATFAQSEYSLCFGSPLIYDIFYIINPICLKNENSL